MRPYKVFIFIILIVSLTAGFSFGQTSRSKKKKAVKSKPKTPVSAVKKEVPVLMSHVKLSVLAEGSYGKMEKPFIYVARNRETYAALQKMVQGLPAEVDFSKNAVVAAFLGMKPTGGYGVVFSCNTLNDQYTGTSLSVSALDPAPGRPVTEALTSPFTVQLVPVEEEKTLELEVGPEWKKAAETYRVTAGNFEFSGGFAFVRKKFDIEGTVSIWRDGGLVTCAFDLSGKGAEKERRLNETASGNISKDNWLNLTRLDAGSFVSSPRPPLAAKGKLGAEKLALEFIPLPTSLADGFAGHGKLEAALSVSPALAGGFRTRSVRAE
jgi:hypothetical protein